MKQVFEHRWPGGLDLPIAVMTVRLDDIATRFGAEPQNWDELAIKGAPGSQLVVDGGDAVSFGIDALVDEVLRAFGLSRNAVAWKAGGDAHQFAARAVATRS